MADDNNQTDDKPVIDLSEVQDIEEEVSLDEELDDILAAEEELLGTGGGDDDSGAKAAVGTAASVQSAASKFHIPLIVKQNYPDLIPLILQTESMDDEEREYWFQILPIMTEDQIQKFRQILISEKEQLAKLDAEYEEELSKINDKHLQEWQAFESKQQRVELEKKEEAAEAQETASEEELLKKLENL